MLKEYKADEITHCAGDRQLLFIGDSNVRQLFLAVAKKLDHDSSSQVGKYAERHGDIQLRPRGVDLRFVWDPYLNGSILANELEIYQESIMPTRSDGKSEVPAVMLVIGGGLWHSRQFEVGAVREFKSAVDSITALSQRRDGSEWKSKSPFNGWEGIGDQVFFVPVEEPLFKRLSPSRQVTIMPDEIDQMNEYLRQLEPSQGLTIPWVNQIMTSKRPFAYEASGLHVIEPIANRRADVILNLRCNAKVDNALGSPYDRTCCSKYTSGNWFQWVLVVLTLVVFSVRVVYTQKNTANVGSLRPFITSMASIGLPLAYSFFADRTQLFNKVQKVYYKSEFLTLCGVALSIGFLTVRKTPKTLQSRKSNDGHLSQSHLFLSPAQIEEWKGWTMTIILFYHWTGAEKQMWIYITVRLLIASYIFLVGYEHTLYLYETADYSIRRVAIILIRFNVLAVALSYQMYTNYLFYYLAPLLSFWSLVVYATFRFGAQLNSNAGFLLGKIFFSASLTVLLHRNDQPVQFIFDALRLIFGVNWDPRDWRFQVSLDPFIVYVGMLVALFYILHRKIESETKVYQ
jgi:N-acetylneuraminate 9-O-acetyltransferase